MRKLHVDLAQTTCGFLLVNLPHTQGPWWHVGCLSHNGLKGKVHTGVVDLVVKGAEIVSQSFSEDCSWFTWGEVKNDQHTLNCRYWDTLGIETSG